MPRRGTRTLQIQTVYQWLRIGGKIEAVPKAVPFRYLSERDPLVTIWPHKFHANCGIPTRDRPVLGRYPHVRHEQCSFLTVPQVITRSPLQSTPRGPPTTLSQLPDITNRPSQALGRLFLGTSTIIASTGISAASFDVPHLLFMIAT